MIIRPVDVPRLRAELIPWLDTATAATLWGKSILSGNLDWFIKTDDVNEAQSIYRGYEIMRLRDADLFYVGGDMVSLSRTAAKSIPDFRLAPEDMPSQTGLMVFEDAPCSLDLNGTPVGIKAVCWGMFPDGRPVIWGTIYLDRSQAAPVIKQFAPNRQPDQEPRLTYAHGAEFTWPIGPNEDRGINSASWLDTFLSILRSAWLLMQQPVSSVSDAEYKRPDRRRLEREKIDLSRVRVITLRRAKSASGHEESDREYHHQWIVRGHWRQQYYPSRDVHRPVWIAPHIKGPEGAPLLGGEKVHAWTR